MNEMRARLPSLGVARVTGGDAVSFMQAHFCNDVQDVVPGQVQLSGYCSPKGRLLAVFHLAHAVVDDNDTFFLVADRSVLKPMLDRLAMFAKMARPAGKQMFAQVTKTDIEITDCSEELVLLGLAGSASVAAVAEQCGMPGVPPIHEVRHHDGITFIAPGVWHPTAKDSATTAERLLCLGSEQQISELEAVIAGGSEQIDEERWLLEDVRAGVPVVLPETQDQFVPQMANMHRLGGLSFTKGCYPGQEIVARMQYLGKLKRRTERFVFKGDAMQPGTIVLDGEGAEIGVVMVAASDGDEGEALVVVRIASSSDSASVRGEDDSLIPLTAAALPYTLDDPAESSA